MTSVRAGLNQKQRQGQRYVQTPSMQLAMRIMGARLDAIRKFAVEAAEDNPLLELVLPDLPQSNAGEIDLDGFAAEKLRAVSLTHHVRAEINLIFSDADDRYLAMAMVTHLSPTGWLDEGVEDVMERAGFARRDIDRVLARLQTMTPAGLWARDLRECLTLQCKDREVWSDDIALVLNNLDSFQSGDIGAVTGLGQAALRDAIDEIRRCNPKPGAMFLYDEGDIFTPDLIMTQTSAGLEVSVNQDGMPSLNVRDDASSDAGSEGRSDAADKILIAEAKKQVSALNRAIQNRAEMMLRAGKILARRQRHFLTKGEAFITPFSMTELAAIMGCHKSTISRLVSDKLVQTPLGMMEMERLFAASLKQPHGADVAGRAVSVKVKSLTGNGRKWTDQMLVAQLKSEGISVARRTVNKYRH